MRAREEQIEEMVQVNSAYLCHEDYTPDNLRMMLAAAISEAEERARAECAADTRRLEWLGKMLKLNAPYQPAAINGKYTAPTLRAAIDAAMEGGNG
ncbi:hypothetical protein [Acetobacter sp. A11-2]|uniref:hypothetical protein n=1 Tax=Acetobacter sp. A11-2 TaxID=3157859 RepID=UPI0032EDCF37